MSDKNYSFERNGILPVINITDIHTAVPLAKALLDSGIDTMEITLRSDCSLDAIRLIKKDCPGMHIGAGTVLSTSAADSALHAGADFIVSPGFDQALAEHCLQQNVLFLPGCTTATEIQAGLKMGLHLFKFFPAEQCGGPAALKLFSGPFPNARFLPTGGIHFQNLRQYLQLGNVIACGGSFMATATQIKSGDFSGITKACQRALEISRSTAADSGGFTVSNPCRAPKNGKKKAVGFGDYLLRLNPQGYFKFIQSPIWEANFTGAEANVCVSLANMGMEAEFVTRLPDNEIARCGIAALNKYRVNTSHIPVGGDRIGIFYVEKGASQRPSRVIYDRMNTGFTSSKSADYDWDSILENAGFFHFTGISPALSSTVAGACLDAARLAQQKGIVVSCDLNYRKNLWTPQQAKAVMETLLPYVDVLIANEEDAEKVLGISAPDTDIIAGRLSRDGYIHVAEQIRKTYRIPTVAITLRQSISASDNRWSCLLYTGDTPYFSREYPIHLVDRVGGGDSFGAGLIYGLSHKFEPQKCIEYAAAASCLKQTMEWDVNLSTEQEILTLANGDGSGRVQR